MRRCPACPPRSSPTFAEGAKTNCPVSAALTGTTITLDATLAWDRRPVAGGKIVRDLVPRPVGLPPAVGDSRNGGSEDAVDARPGGSELAGGAGEDRRRDPDALAVEGRLDPLAQLPLHAEVLVRRRT